MEARKERRVAFHHVVECEGDQGKVLKRSSEISVGGMFITLMTLAPLNSVLKLRFKLPDSKDSIEVTARVRYVHEAIGCGVQFLDLKPRDRDRLERFIDAVSEKRPVSSTQASVNTRVLVDILVVLRGTDPAGVRFHENATIEVLGKDGARIRVGRALSPESTVFVVLPGGSQLEARVVWHEQGQAGIHCRGLAHALGIDLA